MARNEPFLHKLFRWRYFFVVNLLLLVLVALTLGRDFLKTREIQKEISALQAQAEELKTKNLSMSELQTAIQTQSYIEREARLKLGMKKPGEQVVVFTNDEPVAEDLSDTPEDHADPLGLVLNGDERDEVPNTTKWWLYFFNRKQFAELKAYEN